MTDFVMVHGYYWPARDRDCRAVVFDSVVDLEPALALTEGRAVALQAGGNCGVWPAYLAREFDQVFTFEPDTDNYACLRQNVPENVTHGRAALGAEPGFVGMTKFGNNIGAHYISGPGDIPVLTIDGLNLPALDLLCLDVEGYELKALQGAARTIGQFCPVIQFEDKGLSDKYGTPQGAAVTWLEAMGYRVAERIKRDVLMVPT